jgi:hypothetical protein
VEAYPVNRYIPLWATGDAMGIDIPQDKIAAFCRHWMITELAVFGSALRDDFRPNSDVDMLISFAPQARWGLWDLSAMEEDLEQMLSRKVDLITKEGLQQSKNWIRKREILGTAEVVYAE